MINGVRKVNKILFFICSFCCFLWVVIFWLYGFNLDLFDGSLLVFFLILILFEFEEKILLGFMNILGFVSIVVVIGVVFFG